MGDGMEVLRRDYLIAELEEVIQGAGVTGTIAVQARQTMEETERLSELAMRTDLIRGVVGWAPLANPDAERELDRLARLPKLKGMRHVLHDEPDPFFMLRDDFNRGIALLKNYGLRYDLLIFASQLPQTIDFVDRHPNQIFVVDHIAKPRIRDKTLSPWKETLSELALRPNVFCKVSGMVTEAEWDYWAEDELAPYFETVFEVFTPQRTMFGSDWPVMMLATNYGRWLEIVSHAIREFSEHEQQRVLSGTAMEAYGL